MKSTKGLSEDYEYIKEQLNAQILELSDEKEHELMLNNEKEQNIVKLITKNNTFRNAVEAARAKLSICEDDDFPFTFGSREEVIDTLVYVVAFYRGIAEPYLEKENYSDEEELIFKEKGEDYGTVFSQIGQKGVKKLEEEIIETINGIVAKCGLPQSWFTYAGACLLGDNWLEFQIFVKSEHAKRLQVVKVEREFVDLRIWKGIKKDEYNDGWKVLSDYLTHNIPLGLVRVEDEGTRFYNDRLNGKKTTEIIAEYMAQHPCTNEDDAKRALFRQLRLRRRYKNIKTEI